MPAKKILFYCLAVATLTICIHRPTYALDTSSEAYDKITKELNDLNDALTQSVAATKPLQSELDRMQKQIQTIKAEVTVAERDTQIKKQEIEKGYETLARKQQLVLHAIRGFYIKNYAESPLTIFLSEIQTGEKTQNEIYEQVKTKQDKAIITNIALSITDLENKKHQLEQRQIWLTATKANLDQQTTKLDEVVKGALAYQKDVTTKIQELSAQQQTIINARSGGFTATIGDSDLADDYNASIKGFREAAPSGSFAVFAFGAHTHRKGMSQYGARGRAESGQNASTILKAYYGKEPVTKDTGGSIKVTGFGEIDFEGKYLLGIAEMPSSWHPEALKAQAIAARTYAYRYKTEGREICTTEACQVYNDSKAANPPDSWKQAVEATRGQILEDVVTYFASTHGGFADPIGWDTTDGNGGGNFIDKAYDKIGGSPWLYKAWYTKGYSASSDKCGRSNPWLSGSDLADILNAAIVLSKTSDDKITPLTTSCWPGNPYSQNELKQISEQYGGGISNISNVSVIQGNGSTNEVVFQTDKGEKRMSGQSFKTAFNLRASGYLSIPQSNFAFFNIEHK